MSIKVIKSGMYTMIQDLGRQGWQRFGIPVGGAMDEMAAKLVNIVLGNDENEAVIEMTLIGPTLQFKENAIIAIFGANMSPKLNGKTVKHGKPVQVRNGDFLKFGAAKPGVRCYLSVKGGFKIDKVLQSHSTFVPAGIGGLNGQVLKSGDLLPLNKPLVHKEVNWGLSHTFENYFQTNGPIRFIKGRQNDWFTNKSKQQFVESSYTISSDSNRMGFRLNGGPAIDLIEKKELTTEGTAFGSIQIPPNGQPIILMADRQPTGGYPKIGEVIRCDLPRLSQMRPGDKLRFEEVTLEEAQRLLIDEHRELAALKLAFQLKWRDDANV
ncbi:biotin-dependent carboxyltransferase family protein [Lederbergia citrea]|uniref:Biotin-dependent carboxyltransferase family protein n=1 Tax=Lederbergia citrea TaxID=2833581 RepID=A0A942Z6G9_9BACI|nr:biotin-dependent carboxyltransferase family protein [Lederbergia citrea]MBS4224026.1 biotin-dependent carboxyltransferase family protein [Lederbergia citrea]